MLNVNDIGITTAPPSLTRDGKGEEAVAMKRQHQKFQFWEVTVTASCLFCLFLAILHCESPKGPANAGLCSQIYAAPADRPLPTRRGSSAGIIRCRRPVCVGVSGNTGPKLHRPHDVTNLSLRIHPYGLTM